MTGIGMATASGATAIPAPPPFSVSIDFTPSPPGNISVSGASGTLTAGQGVFSILESGGVAPYGQSPNGITYVGRTDTRLFVAPSPDGIHNTLGWSGLSVGDVMSTAVKFTDTDSGGTTKSDTSQTITIQRIA